MTLDQTTLVVSVPAQLPKGVDAEAI